MGSSNLQRLRYFVTLAKTLNFSRTAEQHFVSQTAVSQQIRLLEEELGLTLFERDRHRVALTAAGKIYQDEVVKILELLDSAEQKAKLVGKEKEGKLSCSLFYGVQSDYIFDILMKFKADTPQVRLEFSQDDAEDMFAKIRKGRADIGFGLEPAPIQHPLICRRELGLLQQYVVTSSRSRLAQFVNLKRSQLKGEIIYGLKGPKEIQTLIAGQYLQSDIDAEGLVFRDTLDMIFLEVALGGGCAILAESAISGISRKMNLSFIPLEDESIPLCLYWNRENQNPALKKFLAQET